LLPSGEGGGCKDGRKTLITGRPARRPAIHTNTLHRGRSNASECSAICVCGCSLQHAVHCARPCAACSAVQCSAVQCSAVQCSAVRPEPHCQHLAALHYPRPALHTAQWGPAHTPHTLHTLHCTALHCTARHCTAHCTAQCIAMQCTTASSSAQCIHCITDRDPAAAADTFSKPSATSRRRDIGGLVSVCLLGCRDPPC
jgi:hypothetical protein